jgi:nicotinate-nucleotide adenylyltransferase
MVTPDGVASASTARVILLAATTPNVSATDIRQRAARGESVDGLVPPAVANYIAEHSLYRLEHRLHG